MFYLTPTKIALASNGQNKRELPEEDIKTALGGYSKGGYAGQ